MFILFDIIIYVCIIYNLLFVMPILCQEEQGVTPMMISEKIIQKKKNVQRSRPLPHLGRCWCERAWCMAYILVEMASGPVYKCI